MSLNLNPNHPAAPLQKILLGGALVLIISSSRAQTGATTAPAQTGGVATVPAPAMSTPATPDANAPATGDQEASTPAVPIAPATSDLPDGSASTHTALRRSIDQAQEVALESNLSQIQQIIMMYKQDNDGKLPASFDELKKYAKFPKEMWGNPVDDKPLGYDPKTGMMIIAPYENESANIIKMTQAPRPSQTDGSLHIVSIGESTDDPNSFQKIVAYKSRAESYPNYLWPGVRPTPLNIPAWRPIPVSKPNAAAAWKFVEAGTRAVKANKWSAALINYQRASKLDPNNPYALNGVADSLLVLNRFSQAENAYRRALSRTPGAIKLLRGLADSATAQKKYALALGADAQLLKKSPNDFGANYESAQILTWSRQYSSADNYYRRALASQPHDAEAWTAWGEALSFSRNQRSADAFNRALQIDPQYVRALIGLGNVHLWSGEYSPAQAAFNRALALAPHSVEALTGLGDALTFSSQPGDAIPSYQKALDVEPGNAAAQLGLGRALVLAKREAEAIPVLQRVLSRDPNNNEALNLLADAQGESTPSAALASLQQLLARQNEPRTRAQILAKIGRLQARSGNAAESREAYQQAIVLAPRDTEIALSFAQSLIAQNNWSDAKPVVEDALRNDPANVRALILQVAIESKIGTPERANALATRALALDVTDPQDALTLANAMRVGGNTEGAAQVLTRLASQADTASPVQALEIATALRDAAMYDRAAPIYQNLLQNDSKNFEARLRYAEMLFWQRDYDASQKQTDILLGDDPNNIEARVLAGTVALRRDETNGAAIAETQAAEILKTDPHNVRALVLQTQVLSMRARYAEAVTSAQAAVDADPNNLEARLALARNLHYSKQTSQSVEQYRELIKRAPADATIKLELAKVFLDENQLSDAEVLYSEVLADSGAILPPVAQNADGATVRSNARVSPTFLMSTPGAQVHLIDEPLPPSPAPNTLTTTTTTITTTTSDASTPAVSSTVENQVAANAGLGEVRRREGRWAEAIDYFNAALALDSSSVEARLGLARALRGKGDYLNSLAQAERILQTDETNLGAKVLRAQLLADTGDKTKAQSELDALVASLPEHPALETYLDLSSAFVQLENYDAAIKLLQLAGQDYPNHAEVASRLGETYTFARRWDDALATWNKLIELDPKDASAVLGKARVYNYSNRLADAETNYRNVLGIEPQNYPATVELADILARQSQYPAAIALYHQAIQTNPNDLKTRTELARVLRYNRNFAEAQSVASGVLDVDPRYAPALTERSLARSATGDYEAALVDARAAVALTPDDLYAQLGLAEVLSYTKNYDESIRLYRAALKRDPGNVKARTDFAAALSYNGQYDEALREVNGVLQENPQNLDAQVVKADTLARARRTDEAVTLYRAILRQDNRNLRARVGLAEAYSYNRQYDDAIKIYDELIALDPNNIAYPIAKGRTYGYARRFPQALSTLRPIVQKNPNNLSARLALAEAMTNSGNVAQRREAVASYQNILRQYPDNVDARIGLGRVYSYQGHYHEADAELNAVLKQYPDNTEARYALAESQRFAGDDFTARENYQDVLKTQPQDVGARAGYSIVHRTTSPSVTPSFNHYSDTNGVRLNSYGLGFQLPTRAGTIGISGESGTFHDDGVTLRRRALTLLLAKRFGPLQARLLLSQVNYSGAPDKTLYDLGVQRTFGPRKRIYVTIAKREIIESLRAVERGITAQIYEAGVDYPLGNHFDTSLDVTHYEYSDSNSRTSVSPSLYYRFKASNPTFRLGLGYRYDTTAERRDNPFTYYTPQGYNSVDLLADYVKNDGRLQYGAYGAHPLTNSTGRNGENRPADTLFGFVTYELSDLVDLFVNGGIVRSPDFDSNQVTAGATIHF